MKSPTTDIDDIPWHDGTDRVQLAKPVRCKHLGERVNRLIANEPEVVWAEVCGKCGHVFDPAKQRKGKQVNNLGKAIERWAGKMLRLRRVGQYGGQEDLGRAGDWAFVQVKSGIGWFSEKQYREIEALPRVAGRRRALVTVEKPGADSGRRRRALWIEVLDEVPVPVERECSVCGLIWPEHSPACVRGTT